MTKNSCCYMSWYANKLEVIILVKNNVHVRLIVISKKTHWKTSKPWWDRSLIGSWCWSLERIASSLVREEPQMSFLLYERSEQGTSSMTLMERSQQGTFFIGVDRAVNVRNHRRRRLKEQREGDWDCIGEFRIIG